MAPNFIDPAVEDASRPSSPAWQDMGEYRLVQRLMYDAFLIRYQLVQRHYDGGRKTKTQHRVDRRWVRSESRAAFSFCWCCEVLGLSPGYTRAAYWAAEPVVPLNHSAMCSDVKGSY